MKHLGYVVSEDKISTKDDKIKSIENWKLSETVKELKRFRGFAGYYHRSIGTFPRLTNLHSKSPRPMESIRKQSFVTNGQMSVKVHSKS